MNIKKAAIILLASPLGIPVASATTVFPQEFTCPIGDEKFEDYVIGSTSSWGQRPDGKAIGGVAPWPVVECPSNGLPIFKEKFEVGELAILSEAIKTPEFAMLREEDTTYRRIWWLQEKLGANPYDLTWRLLQASWETDENPERKARYQRDFAASAEALVRDEEHAETWFWLNLRAANAYRETGRFESASMLIFKIDKPEYLPADYEQKLGALELISQLKILIYEKNTASQPTNLIGARNAIFRCIERPTDMTSVEIAACESSSYRKELREFQEYEKDQDSSASAAAEAEAIMAAAEALEEAPESATVKPSE